MNLKRPHALRLTVCFSSSSPGVYHAPIFRPQWLSRPRPHCQQHVLLSSPRWPVWSSQRSLRLFTCSHTGRATNDDNDNAPRSISLTRRSRSITTRCVSQGIQGIQDQHHQSSSSSSSSLSSFSYSDTRIIEEYNVNEHQLQKLQMFAKLVIEENSKVNLISRVQTHQEPSSFFAHVMQRHVLDSLSLLPYLDMIACESDTITIGNGKQEQQQTYRKKLRIVDVGTGGGFPGISIAIMRPQYSVVLCDATQKKINFVKRAIEELDLGTNATALCARLENLGHLEEHRESYDVAVSRAVAALTTLSEYCLPLLKYKDHHDGGTDIARASGWMVAQKGRQGHQLDEEIHKSMKAISVLGGELESCDEIRSAQSQGDGSSTSISSSIVVIKKNAKTPSTYPRKVGMPKKRPISL